MRELLKKILALPRRIEPIGGQNYSYLCLEDVTGLIETELAKPVEPVAWMYDFVASGHMQDGSMEDRIIEDWISSDFVESHSETNRSYNIRPLYFQKPTQFKDHTTFNLGDTVKKKSGSQWKGKVVGYYSTTLTPEGYAIESDTEIGSVQIYPAKALELCNADS